MQNLKDNFFFSKWVHAYISWDKFILKNFFFLNDRVYEDLKSENLWSALCICINYCINNFCQDFSRFEPPVYLCQIPLTNYFSSDEEIQVEKEWMNFWQQPWLQNKKKQSKQNFMKTKNFSISANPPPPRGANC